MKKTTLSALKAGSAPLVLGLALISTQAMAQDAAEDEAAAEDGNVIVVTGSLIKNPNLVQSNPVNVTTSDAIELKQSNLAEEVLREIPGVVPNIGSAVNNGNGGSSYVDLRGLGSNRNVVLLDGNRIVPADLAGRVDLNNIPLALISRVDAQTGAAVTTYGADAITGVVNFITKKDFSGVDLSLGEQITEKGDGAYFRGDLTIGANFDDGKGNAVLSIGYQKSDPVYQGDRDFSLRQVSSFTGGPAGSGTGVPGRFSGTRPLAGSAPNTLQERFLSGYSTTANAAYDPTKPTDLTIGLNTPFVPILGTNTTGTANGGVRQINANGQAVSTFATFNFNPYNIFQTPFKRYNIFAQANYEISDSVEVYTRGLFSKNTVDTIIAPSGSFGGTVTVNLNNPYLPAALRNQWCAFNIAPNITGVDSTGAAISGQTTYTPRFTPAQCAAAATATGPSDPNYKTVTVTYNRRATEVGPRISNYSTTIFDYRMGLRGRITDTINWDVNASYGESEKLQTIKNYTLQSRWRQAALANNTTTCIDSSNGCVPVNLFGADGSITPAMAAFLTANSSTKVKTSLTQLRGLVSGEMGITSPGANNPVNFALGAEYRSYTAEQASDLLAKTPGELGGAGGAAPDINGAYNVYEAYGELIAPLMEDKPGFNSLTLEAGARYSKYNVRGGGSPETWTYKVGLSWEPIADLKLRGNYARAVRAPNIGELFTPVTVGLTNLGVDPCAGAAPTTNANLRAICLAQGAPAGTIGSITNPTAGQANIATGGNLNITPEKARTWTVGAVIQPSFLPRFSMTVDYYNIKVTDVIGSPLPGDLVNACFGSITAASATSTACTVIRRNPITGGLDGDPAITQGLFAPLDNLGTLKSDGIDLVMNYSHEFGAVKWNASFVGNYTLNQKFKATPGGIDRECTGYFSVNCGFTGSIPMKYQWSLRNTFTYGKWDLSVLWRHLASVEHEPLDIADQGAFFSGTAPAGTGPIAGTSVDFNKIPSYDYIDLTLRWNVSDNFTFTAAVQNLFNKQPPIVGNTAGSTSYNSGNTYPSTYDALGRRFAVSGRVKF
ncbi:MAG: TonB-dependent receptor domain-containing protein [Novosphingobium sp.]